MARQSPRQTRRSVKSFQSTSPGELFWDLLTFDKLMTGPVIHLIYWAGLAIVVLGGFATVGGAVGVALREEGIMGVLLALPVLVAGFLVLAAGALLWRSFCEFYVAVFRISDDLRAMRTALENGAPAPAAMADAARAVPDAGEERTGAGI
ncbi:MAG TPA: DUF4282 domain-containing protein [Caulobacteraceae bacterium]|nr:DUF4282 domain-containing protein [Caulobacteraceae bacterium]